MKNDFNHWEEYNGANEGSGRSEKIWLKNQQTGQIGLFKYKKDVLTTDHVSEKLASDIARLVMLPCADVELGRYKGNQGSMSYLINARNEVLIEGISFINQIYPDYNAQEMYDKSVNEYYSLEMLVKTIEKYGLLTDLLKMLVFDYLIGNSDRHQNNWALIQDSNGNLKFSPLYDNSSSLCCYVKENDIPNILGRDLNRIRALVDTKSRSIVRLDKKAKRTPRHYEVLSYIWENYNKEIAGFVELIKVEINETAVNKILSKYPEDILNNDRKILIKKFLAEKVKLMYQLDKGEED